MPIYEYNCSKCESEFEILVRGDATPECPNCGGIELAKLFSVPAAHSSGTNDLPVCQPAPPSGGCGLPQCGMGGCQME